MVIIIAARFVRYLLKLVSQSKPLKTALVVSWPTPIFAKRFLLLLPTRRWRPARLRYGQMQDLAGRTYYVNGQTHEKS